MIDVIPTSEAALETWLVDSSGNVAVSGAGLALLEAQIMSLHGATDEEFGSPNEPRAEG